ncbi:hypothetical protein BH10PSE13_BH10PSE13_18980 [soil metagenome]
MIWKLRRLFVLKTKFEVFLVIYALALGASERGIVYLDHYPGWGGKLLALACTGSVFLAGGLMIDAVDMRENLASAY